MLPVVRFDCQVASCWFEPFRNLKLPVVAPPSFDSLIFPLLPLTRSKPPCVGELVLRLIVEIPETFN